MVSGFASEDRLTQMKYRATAQLAILDLVRSLIPEENRAPLWEITTATGYLHAGADILTLAHPQAIDAMRQAIDELMAG